MEVDPTNLLVNNQYSIEMTMICTGWNDEDVPLTQNMKMVHSAMMDTCLSFSIPTAASYDWNRCKGSLIGEFQEYSSHLILGLGRYVLIAVIRDNLGYETVYKLPNIKVTIPVIDTVAPTMAPTLNPSGSPTMLPTWIPTKLPTMSPTVNPTRSPLKVVTLSPSTNPTKSLTKTPTSNPTLFPSTNPLAIDVSDGWSSTTTTSTRNGIGDVDDDDNVPDTDPDTDPPPDLQCNMTVVMMIESNVIAIVHDLDSTSQQLSSNGDTQLYFQALQAMDRTLGYYIDKYSQCLSSATKEMIFVTKLRIIELTRNMMDGNSTTKTYDNLQHQLHIISSVLDLFCAGSNAYDDDRNCESNNHRKEHESKNVILEVDGQDLDYSDCISTSDMIRQSAITLNELADYFTENASAMLFGIVEDLVTDILTLDEFQEDVLDETMSDALIDIVSSIHIWFVPFVGLCSLWLHDFSISHA